MAIASPIRTARIKVALLAGALLVLWPWLYFWRAALGQGMFFVGDTAQFWYPTRLAYAAALHAGGLPLWVRDMFGGFPLFAEMQTGALYPPHLLLYYSLPTEIALDWDILIHLSWMGLGMFLFARRWRVGIAGAFLAGLVYAGGGMAHARLSQMNVISTMAWLPWTLWCYEAWSARRSWARFGGLVLALTCVILLGHPQYTLLTFLLFAAYVLARSFRLLPEPSLAGVRQARRSDWIVAAIAGLAAVGVAAAQVLPTLELAQWSTRALGEAASFSTSFSLHPLQAGLMLDPFILGNPYPRVSVEVVSYVGLVPLLLVALLVLFHRDRVLFFWLAVGGFGLVLALGSYNPIYQAVVARLLPSFFRAPARFLLFTYFALALLAGIGLDQRLAQMPAPGEFGRGTRATLAAFVLLLAAVAGLTPSVAPEAWVNLWQFNATLLLGGALAVWWFSRRAHLTRALLAALAIGGTALDVALFGAVYVGTFNALLPVPELRRDPRVLQVLDLTPGQGRVYPTRWIAPWPGVMRESLYPNLGLAYGVESAPGYTPLTPFPVQAYLGALSQENLVDLQGRVVPADPCAASNRTRITSAGLLNALGVRYYLIPQVLPATPDCERADLYDPLGLQPGEDWHFTPTPADRLTVESSLAQSAGLPDGTTIAEIQVTLESGEILTRTLEAGRDTAEWAYDRSDVRAQVKHGEPPVASSFPARSAIPVESHLGHTYQAEFALGAGAPVMVTGLRVQPRPGPAVLHLASITLDAGNTEVSVADLIHRADHALIYRSEDVAVFENRDVLPRARLIHTAQVALDAEALKRMQQPDWDPRVENFLADGANMKDTVSDGATESARISTDQDRRVVVEVQAAADGYLVLADPWYPGWVARVDGQVEPIARADVMFRAVRVLAGSHRVEFTYEPASFALGRVVSGTTLLALAGAALFAHFARRTFRVGI